MRNFNLLAFIGMLCLSANAISQTHTIYICESHHVASACAGGCEKADILGNPWRADFLVDRKTNSVMMRDYVGSGAPDAQVYKNCTIFDKNNWDCSEEPLWTGKWYVFLNKKMVNGVYAEQTYTSRGGEILNRCAK